MKKIGFIILALVLVFGTMGVGFSMWFQTVTVNGNVNTGKVSVGILNQWNDDPPPNGYAGSGNVYAGSLDPNVDGIWIYNSGTQTWAWSSGLGGGNTGRYDKNVADTVCQTGTDANGNPTITVTIENGYPSYHGNVLIPFTNTGTIPVKISGNPGFFLTDVHAQVGSATYDKTYNMGLYFSGYYFMDNESNLGIEGGSQTSTNDGDDALYFTLSNEYQANNGAGQASLSQIDPGQTAYINIAIHVEQQATQNASYSFTITAKFQQWNES